MGKPPSLNDIRRNAAAFATRWADATDERKEAQTFWNEFFQVFGVDRRRVAFFELAARRQSTGGRGSIDLFWPGVLIAEHKSAGRSLEDAEEQAIDYLNSIDQDEFPGVVITSDFQHFRVRDLGGDNTPVEFPLKDLGTEIERFGFIAGYQRRAFSSQQEEEANIKAAQLMGRLYEQLAAAGYDGHEASILMTRLLFLLFGDDTGMWERSLFAEFLATRTQPDGSDLGSQMAMLFQLLDTPGSQRLRNTDELLARFPYVNGGLFSDRIAIPAFDNEMRDELVACCDFDWSTISPAIFGSLFQAIKSREDRRVLGEHYTTERAILRLIQPLFLDELRAQFDSARDDATRLRKLRERLGQLRFLDPACGCGNFLVVAYRELRQLELDIMEQLRHLSGDTTLALDATLDLRVRLDQFYGIEIEEWPAKIAETAMFLVDHQANRALEEKFGQAPERLPIEVAATIFHGNALTVDWNELLPATDDVIVLGNPPFVGSRMTNPEQKADQSRVWAGNKRQGTLDFVTNWFKIAAEYAEGTQARVGFVATNSITQGEQPAVLWTELHARGMGIDFAHRTFAWTSEAAKAASVHVVIIGFSSRPKKGKRPLWDYPDIKQDGLVVQARQINPYLVDASTTVISSRQTPLVPGIPAMRFGSMPRDGGHISKISAEEAAIIQDTDPAAAKYLRRVMGARELIHNEERWCLWLVDANPTDIRNSAVLRDRVDKVRAFRLASKAPSTRAFGATPSLFAQLAQPTQRYLAVPSVSSELRDYTPLLYLPADVIALNLLMTVAGADDVLFGTMSSRAFSAWNRTVSGRLESRIRISQEVTYNNFPWLGTDDPRRDSIAAAARSVLSARGDFEGQSLADLYDVRSMPSPLATAHRDLDKAVLRAYGLKASATDAEVVARLIERYEGLLRASE